MRPGQLKDIRGWRFGRLVVVEHAWTKLCARRIPVWRCRCDCGADHFVQGPALRATRSCGCYRREVLGRLYRTHGESKTTGASREYETWCRIKGRCRNPRNQDYPYYGGRGLDMCETWARSFERFLSDVGRRPGAEYSIERIDNERGYEPGNVRWATRKEQANNRRPRGSHLKPPVEGPDPDPGE